MPAADTDFVFAVVGEQLGFMGALPVVILLGTFIVAGFRTAQGAPDVFGSLLAAGISIWFLVQMTVNLLEFWDRFRSRELHSRSSLTAGRR